GQNGGRGNRRIYAILYSNIRHITSAPNSPARCPIFLRGTQRAPRRMTCMAAPNVIVLAPIRPHQWLTSPSAGNAESFPFSHCGRNTRRPGLWRLVRAGALRQSQAAGNHRVYSAGQILQEPLIEAVMARASRLSDDRSIALFLD